MKRELAAGGSFLIVNVNNTFTKFTVSTLEKLGAMRRYPTAQVNAEWVAALARRHPGKPVLLSSVVPAKTTLFEKAFSAGIHRLHGKARLGIEIFYPKKSEIGADRLANAIAARHLFGGPAVVVDFGTAVTFDIIDASGAYCGGVIAPGLNMMTDYLHERTALLPKVSIREPLRAIGKSTREAIRVGAVIGYRGMIREILGAVKHDLGNPRRLHVVATGGQAGVVAGKMPEIEAILPTLTLDGIRLWGATVLKRAA